MKRWAKPFLVLFLFALALLPVATQDGAETLDEEVPAFVADISVETLAPLHLTQTSMLATYAVRVETRGADAPAMESPYDGPDAGSFAAPARPTHVNSGGYNVLKMPTLRGT